MGAKIEFTKDCTYRGIKEFEAILRAPGEPIDGAKVVIRQESDGKTWLVANRYFSDGLSAERELNIYRRGLTRREAKELAKEILLRGVVGVEPGGRLILFKTTQN